MLETLAKDEDPSVRAAVINNPRTPNEIRETVRIDPIEWALPLVEPEIEKADESMGNPTSSIGLIKLRSVSVAWRLFSASQPHPYLEIRTETIMPGFVGTDIACLGMDDDGFRSRLRVWLIGTAFRHIQILDSVSGSEPGASFTAAVNEIRKLCVEQHFTSPRELKNSELVNRHVETIASISQRELDERYPTRSQCHLTR